MYVNILFSKTLNVALNALGRADQRLWDVYSSIPVSSRLAVDGLLCTPLACRMVLVGCRRWPDGLAFVALVWLRVCIPHRFHLSFPFDVTIIVFILPDPCA